MNEQFQEIKDIIVELEDDILKFFDQGNKAAGVRARKKLQELRKKARQLRFEILKKRKDMDDC